MHTWPQQEWAGLAQVQAAQASSLPEPPPTKPELSVHLINHLFNAPSTVPWTTFPGLHAVPSDDFENLCAAADPPVHVADTVLPSCLSFDSTCHAFQASCMAEASRD